MRSRHCILTWRMALTALLIGMVLAVASVPVAAVIRGFVPASSVEEYYIGGPDRWIWRVEQSVWPGTNQYIMAHAHGGIFAGPEDPDIRVWSELSIRHWFRPQGQSNVTCITTGWPLRSAGSYFDEVRPSVGHAHFSLLGHDVRVPYLPLWPGLLANTLFYAALALTPMVLLRWRRTRRRRARGLCVACGYELGEDVAVCPECGLEAS